MKTSCKSDDGCNRRKEADIDKNRRNLLKTAAAGAIGATLLPSGSEAAETKLSMPSSKKHARIVIVGGGMGGIDAAARLRRSAPNAQIVLIAPNEMHLYQSGQIFEAVGLSRSEENRKATQELIPDGVTWLRENVNAFFPDQNKLEASRSGEILYDILVVALGCVEDYSLIEGIERDDIGKNGITSVYCNDPVKGESTGGTMTHSWMEEIYEYAAVHDVTILFADPDTPFKAINAPLDMLFLCHDRLRGRGEKEARGSNRLSHAKMTYATPKKSLIGVSPYDKALGSIIKRYKQIDMAYSYRLKAVDTGNKSVTFETSDGTIVKSYDFLHLTPPMRAPEVLRQSDLADESGDWMEVDPQTLQHPRYHNVFGLGDVVNIKNGKSGGATRDQAIVIQDNVSAFLEDIPLPAKYTGYSVAPVKTAFGREMLIEYDRKGVDTTFPLDPTEARWLWWEVDLHMMRWVYFNLIIHGMM
jgi:sulfide:quinone oxidoreductase